MTLSRREDLYNIFARLSSWLHMSDEAVKYVGKSDMMHDVTSALAHAAYDLGCEDTLRGMRPDG